MIDAAFLDPMAYEAVERDDSACDTPGLAVVFLTAVASGIGGLGLGIRGLLGGVIASLLAWVLYVAAAYAIGIVFFRTPQTLTTLKELLRTLGFAQAPCLLLVFAGLPILGPLLIVIVSVWMLVTTVVAIRSALDFSMDQAIGTAIIAWLMFIIPFGLLLAFVWLLPY
jgi:Yip1 domain